jgi:hypothetical protein
MPLLGNEGFLSQPTLEPVFLLDDDISYRFAPALSSATGNDIKSVRCVWDDRDRFINPVQDEEIITYLGEIARDKGVWITADWDARIAHAKLIMAEQISVLWLHEPKGKALRGLQELQLLSLVVENVYTLVANSNSPVYLRTHMNGHRPRLDRLAGTLYDSKLNWVRVPLK